MNNQYKIFYSWQSDLPSKTNRKFIQDALDKALERIKHIAKIDADRDTKGVPGSPEIHGTIFDKISQTDFFLADVSFINGKIKSPNLSSNGISSIAQERLTPNPNVLIELGYALSQLGDSRIIMVFNSEYGKIEDLPFDIKQKRIMKYNSSAKAKGKLLEDKLEEAIIALIEKQKPRDKQSIFVDLSFDDKARKSIGKKLCIKSTNNLILDESQSVSLKRLGIKEKFYYGKCACYNSAQCREIFNYFRSVLRYEKILLSILNKGSYISNICVELLIPKSNGFDVIKCLPNCPKKDDISLPMLHNDEITKNKIKEDNDYYYLEFRCDALHPSRRWLFDEEYFIGADKSCNLDVMVKIYASGLDNYIEDKLFINIDPKEQHIKGTNVIMQWEGKNAVKEFIENSPG